MQKEGEVVITLNVPQMAVPHFLRSSNTGNQHSMGESAISFFNNDKNRDLQTSSIFAQPRM